MVEAEIKLNEDNSRICVSGAVSFITVVALRDKGLQLLLKSQQPIFDLQGVTRCDSSALALFTAWSRAAKKAGKVARFLNVPAQLMDVARLSHLDKVLLFSTDV